MGLCSHLGLFQLFLALLAQLLEAADCTCNGYITPRGQGECKTTYKVVRSMSESCFVLIEWKVEETFVKKEKKATSDTCAGRHLLLC